MATTVDTSLVVAQFGDHYIPAGQNEKRLMSALRETATTTKYAKTIIHDGDTYRFAHSRLGEIVQQFQKDFTPKGKLSFLPREIKLRNLKIDLKLYPDEVKGTWLGFLQALKEQDRAKWPLVRFMIENEVIPQLKQDMEMKAYFKGKFIDPTAGTPGTTSDSLDGVKTLLDAGIADSSMQSVGLSAPVTNANAFDMVEEFVDGIDPLLNSVKKRVYMSEKLLRAYHRDKRNTHGTDVNYDAKKPVVDFTNIELVGLPSMAGENYIWATPVDNFLYLRRQNAMKKPKVEEAERQVKLMADWWEGLGFGYNELVYVSKW